MVLPSLPAYVRYNFFSESQGILGWTFNHKIGMKLILIHLNVKISISVEQLLSLVILRYFNQLIDSTLLSFHSY